MKIKATQKQIKENYSNILAIGYAEYYHLLDKYKAMYYTCGVYGWNADIFIDYKTDTAIVTGYRTFGDRLKDKQLAIFEKYNNKARKLKKRYNDYNFSDTKIENKQCFEYKRLDYILDKMLETAIKKALKCK
jgi:hypothetical protein